MVRIPDDVVARLNSEVSVQRLIGGVGVALQVRGDELGGPCPFHDDADDSADLVVDPPANRWRCSGPCGLGGGVVEWVRAAQGVSARHGRGRRGGDPPEMVTSAGPWDRRPTGGPRSDRPAVS